MWRIRSAACRIQAGTKRARSAASGSDASSATTHTRSIHSVARAAHATAARACLPCAPPPTALRPAATLGASCGCCACCHIAPSRAWSSRAAQSDGASSSPDQPPQPPQQPPPPSDASNHAPAPLAAHPPVPSARADARSRPWANNRSPPPDQAKRLRELIVDLQRGESDPRASEASSVIRALWGGRTRVSSLSPVVARRALVTCYMLECLPGGLVSSRGEPGVVALPTDLRALLGPSLPRSSTTYKMMASQIRDADHAMTTFKAAPAGASQHDGCLVPTGAEVRRTAAALVVLLRALGDSGLHAYLRPDSRLPNDKRQHSSDGGGRDGGQMNGHRSWNRMDAAAFPHLALEGGRTRCAPRLLVDAREVVRKHLDLLLWPPPAAADDAQPSDATTTAMSAVETVAQAQREWDQPSLAGDPSLPSVVSLSYPHASPARNLVTIVSLFQPLRGSLSSTDLVVELLRLASNDWAGEVDELRQRRPPHFLDSLGGLYITKRDRADTNAREGDALKQEAEAEAAGEADEADDEFATDADADAPAASDQTLEADAEANEAELAARADDVEETQTDEKLDQPPSEPASRAEPSSSSSSSTAASSPPVRRLPMRMRTLIGALNPAEMLLLVEAWAAHNCVSRCRHFCSAIESYLHSHSGTSFRHLSLSQLHRWLLCISTMELMIPISESLLQALSRVVSGPTVALTPLGTAQPILRMPARWFEHCARLEHVQQQAALITTHNPQSAPSGRAPSLLLGNVFCSMLCAYGPIAVHKDDVHTQWHIPADKRMRLLSQMHDAPSSFVAVVRATCDYLTAVMRDQSTMDAHVAVHMHRAGLRSPPSQPSQPQAQAQAQPPLPHPAQLVLEEVTNVAWALILMRMDHNEFVHHFFAAYIQWFEANFTMRDKAVHEHDDGGGGSGGIGVYYRGEELPFSHSIWRLTRRMHQVALQLFLRSTTPHSRLSTRFMPLASVVPQPPPLPAALNFSSATRDFLLRLLRTDVGPLNVSSLQLDVYQLMRDPAGPMHFRQRVLHSNFNLHMSNNTREHFVRRERLLHQAEAEAAAAGAGAASSSPSSSSVPSSVFFDASSEAADALLLSDGLSDADAARAELSHAQGTVDLFIEHKTTLGYVIDAAIFMKLRPQQQQQQQRQSHQHPHSSPSSPLTSLPSVRVALSSSSPEWTAPFAPLRTLSVALETDGPYHFCATTRYYLNATSRLKARQLRDFGWFVLRVPYFEWNRLADPGAQSQWLADHLPRSMLKKERDEIREYKEEKGRRQQEEQQEHAAERIRRLRAPRRQGRDDINTRQLDGDS